MSSAGLPILAGTKPPWLLVASKSSDCSSYLPSAPHRVQTPRAANGINSISSSALSLGWKAYPSRSLLPVRAKGFDGETPIGEDHQSQSEDLKPTSVQSNPGSQNFLTFLCPLLKLLGGGDPAAPRNVFLETATSGVASMARLPWGSKTIPEAAAARASKGQPPKLFQLYEFEACPFCRRVREALTELDLSTEVYPCPKGSVRHREFVRQVGGKDQFPFFVDPNTGVTLYESSDIVKYLFKEYGEGKEPSPGLLGSTLVTGWVPTVLRAGRGMMRYSQTNSDAPEKKLELYSYENNQFARLVREALCELELPYVLRSAGKGSSVGVTLLGMTGSTKVPYLVDPNTGAALAESQDIIAYLFATYSTGRSQPVSA